LRVARALLGKILVHRDAAGDTAGIIVETEAYLLGDPASHASRVGEDGVVWSRVTDRNRSMFGPPGHAYVYFTYGNHYCLNVVTRREGVPEAVLIRALAPIDGLAVMRRRRRAAKSDRDLTNGPGKLTQALGIDRRLDGCDLTGGSLVIIPGERPGRAEIVSATRIGIRRATEQPWRFYLAGNSFVSRR
jgi:DNA-3-methyladenine glycosylase